MPTRQPRRERISRGEQAGSLTGAAAVAKMIWEGLEAFWPTVGQTFSEGNAMVVLGMVLVFFYSVVRDWLPGKSLAKAGAASLVILSVGCAFAATKHGVHAAAGSDSYAQSCAAYDADGTCAEPQVEVRGSPISEVAGDMLAPVFRAVETTAQAALSLVCGYVPGLCSASEEPAET